MFTRLDSINIIILSVGYGGLAGKSYDSGTTFGDFAEISKRNHWLPCYVEWKIQ